MAQRPSIKAPKPLTRQTAMSPAEVARLSAEAQALASSQMLSGMQQEVSAEAAPLWNFVLNHARALTVAVLAIIALIIAAGAWRWHEESVAEQARMELGRASASPDAQTRLDRLRAFNAEAPASVRSAADLELASAATQAGDWQLAATVYGALADREGASPLGVTSRLNEADLLMRLNRPADALTCLEDLLPSVPPAMQSMLHQQIAEAAEAAKQPQRAIAAYEAALAALSPADSAEAAYFRARIASLR